MHPKCMINYSTVAVALVSLALFSPISAETDEVNTGDFLLSRSPATAPSAALSYTDASEIDFDSAAGGFSYRQLDLSTPLGKPYHLNSHHALVLGVDYRATWLQTDTFIGDQDLHRFRFNLRWMYRQPGSKWSWTAALSPGIGTDGHGISAEDFTLNAQLSFRYRVSDSFAWLGGIVVLHDSVETRVFPGLGFQWNVNESMQVTFSGIRLNASWQPSADWLVSFRVQPGGGAWNIDHQGVAYNVGMRSFQAMLGVEHRIAKKTWLGIWVGATFANEVEIESEGGGDLFDDDADTGWFVRLGVRRVFW